MASERERWLGHIELYLHVMRRLDVALSLEDALHHLVKNKSALKNIRQDDGRWTVTLSDINYIRSKDAFCLLFLGVDSERGDAIFADLQTLALRRAQKLITEGGAISAHFCISAKPGDGTDRHKAVLEEVEGLSRARVIPFLKQLLISNCSFEEMQDDGSILSAEANLAANTVDDKPLGQQLQEAKLLAVDFVRKGGKGDIDRVHGFLEKARLIQFRPTGSATGAKAAEIIRSILNRPEKNEYPETRIKIEDSAGRQRTVRADDAKKDALLSAFQKRTLLSDLEPPLPEASSDIVEHFAVKMADSL